MQDLELLNIRGDKITHTSDYFNQIYELAIQIIKSGQAYADDTEQLQVRNFNLGIMHKCRQGQISDA